MQSEIEVKFLNVSFDDIRAKLAARVANAKRPCA